MKVGITLPNVGPQATVENISYIARRAEHEGFDSLWTIRRILWPIEPQTPYLVTSDGSLPKEYQYALDALDVLAYVSAITDNISLGTHVEDMFFFTPIILAKRFVTLDVLSNGRVISGLGIGWSKDEYQASNIPFNNRAERADEFICIMKKIWTDNVVNHEGKYYTIPPSRIDPKPIQNNMRVYLGGAAPGTFARIRKFGLSGWIGALVGRWEYVEKIIEGIKLSNDNDNKDHNKFQVIMVTFPNIIDNPSSSSNNERVPFTGTIDQIGEDINRLKTMGVEHIIFNYNFVPIGKDPLKVIEVSKELARFTK